MSDEPTPTPTGGAARSKPAPNYAARRMLVTTVAIVSIVAFAVIGWTVVKGDGDGVSGPGGSWNEIALVDRATGEVTVVDDNGEVVRTIVGRGRVVQVHTVGDRMALVGTEQIVLEGGEETPAIPIGRTDEVTPLRTADTLHLIVGNPNGGNVVIIDVITAETIDIGALAKQAEPQIFENPLLFAETVRASADARSFAVADASSFQTIVVQQGSEEVAFFGSQPVALSGDRVATSQIIGGQADIELLDYERTSKARVPAPIPAGGIMMNDDLLMVSIDGGVYRIESGQTEAERIGEVAVPSGATVDSVQPTFDGDRLVVSGTVFQAVVDLEGGTIFTTTFTQAVEAVTPAPGWTCLPIGGGDTYHSLVAMEAGDQLADLSGVIVIGAAADGCTVLGKRASATEVISADGIVALGRVGLAALGPDGRTVVRTSVDGSTEILRIDDELQVGDALDLTAVTPRSVAIAFLD